MHLTGQWQTLPWPLGIADNRASPYHSSNPTYISLSFFKKGKKETYLEIYILLHPPYSLPLKPFSKLPLHTELAEYYSTTTFTHAVLTSVATVTDTIPTNESELPENGRGVGKRGDEGRGMMASSNITRRISKLELDDQVMESTYLGGKSEGVPDRKSFEYCCPVIRTLLQPNLAILPSSSTPNKQRVLKKKKKRPSLPLPFDDSASYYGNIYSTCAASYGMLGEGCGYMNRGGRQSLMSMLVKRSWY